MICSLCFVSIQNLVFSAQYFWVFVDLSGKSHLFIEVVVEGKENYY